MLIMVKTGYMHMTCHIISIKNKHKSFYASLMISMAKFKNFQEKVMKISYKKMKIKLSMLFHKIMEKIIYEIELKQKRL